MAWLEPRGPKRWFIRWRLHDGTVPAQGPYASKAQATSALEAIEKQHPPRKRRRKNGPLPGVALPWAEVVDAWAASRLADRRITQASVDEYKRTILRITGEDELNWPTTGHVNTAGVTAWVALRRGRGTARPLSYLRSVYLWASEKYNQPFDRRSFITMRPPPSRENPVELMPDEVEAGVHARARAFGENVALLSECLATYGWRSITAARLIARDFNPAGTMTLRVKRRANPLVHALTPEHTTRFAKLVKGLAPDAPIFVRPTTKEPWLDKRGKATPFTTFYRWKLQPQRLLPEKPPKPGEIRHRDRRPPTAPDSRWGGSYALKRLGITRLRAAGVDPKTIAEITGHKTVSQVERYFRTNLERTREALDKLVAARGAPAVAAAPAANPALPMHSEPAESQPERQSQLVAIR